MRTKKELLTGRKSTYKIVDYTGNIIAEGFVNQNCAAQMIPKYKLGKRDKLEIVEVNE